MSEDQKIPIEVAYALPDKQAIVPLEVESGTTVVAAAEQSSIVDQFEGLTLEGAKFGIFGKAVANTHVMSAGERVEIYRPLLIDPKAVRKARAEEARERRAKDKDAAKE